MKKKMIFATQNKGKIKEVNDIFYGSGIEFIPLPEIDNKLEIEETGLTFEENARIKATEVFNKYRVPVMSDDSGLSVAQLDGAPGVFSARYAGKGATDDDNNRKLIRELEKFNEPHHAAYICCAVYYDGKQYNVSSGEVRGMIIKNSRGKNGFGYDPFFVPEGYSQTMAELTLEEKNNISHRSKAFKNLKNILQL
jgi:XTP/dITP diphosphohydrolase